MQEQSAGKKRLLLVSEAMGGGVFTYLVNLANSLVDAYELYLAYAMRPQTPKDYRAYFDSRIHLIEVESFVRPIRPNADLRALFELRRIYRVVRPDIIHLHSSKAGILGRLASWRMSVPVFYTPHGYSFLMRGASVPKRAFYYLAELAMARTRCTTIACSKGELIETKRLTKRAFLVNNGIDLHEIDGYVEQLAEIQNKKASEIKSFDEATDEALAPSFQVTQGTGITSARPYTIFTIGRICDQKNPELFNQIALALPDAHFVWIGDGELRDMLSAPNIEITGWMDRSQALAYAMRADCFVLPSLWEGLPMSLLEAMYLKKPCVVSNVVGNRDVIHDGINGFACESLNQYIHAIRECAKAGVAERLCANAFKDVIDEYNCDTMVTRYKAVYEQALGGAKVCAGGASEAAFLQEAAL